MSARMSARSQAVPDEEAGIVVDPEGGDIEGADDLELTQETALETEMTNPEETPDPENPNKEPDIENPAENDLDETPEPNDNENDPEEPENVAEENDDMD